MARTPDPLHERSAVGGHDELTTAAQLFEIGERLCIRIRIATQADGKVVAAVLAFSADPARQPPDRGVIEQQRLDESL